MPSIVGSQRFAGNGGADRALKSLDPTRILENATRDGLTPWASGDSRQIQTVKPKRTHHNFTQQEVEDLRVKAADRKRQVKLNVQGYKAQAKIESLDAADQSARNTYQVRSAKATEAKAKSDGNKAKALYGMTTNYANLNYGLRASHQEAQVQVREAQALFADIKAKYA